MSVTSCKPVSSLVIWHVAPESPIQVFFVNKEMCHHLWCTSYQPPKAVLNFLQTDFLFLHSFLLSLVTNTTSHHLHPHQLCFLLFQIFVMAILPCPTILTHMPLLVAMVAHSLDFFIFKFMFFCFLIIFFFFIFIRVPFLPGLWPYLLHFLHCCFYYLLYVPNTFLFQSFLLFTFNFLVPEIQFFMNWFNS